MKSLYLPSLVPVLLTALLLASPSAYPAESTPTPATILYVSPSGNDSNTGESSAKALKSPAAAVARAAAGTVIRFDAGNYPPLKVSGKSGTAAKPIVLEAVAGKERQATFSSGRMDGGIAINVELSSHVHVLNLRATNSQKGIVFDSVSHGVVQGNLVQQLGQEGIHIGRQRSYSGAIQFTGPESAHVRVVGNRVEGTGKVTAIYGEGIYIGQGALRGDHTHDILIEDNDLTDIGAEAIELKAGVHDITVRRNRISNTHHEYNGAITVSVEGSTNRNGNFLIEDNLIWQIKKVKHGVAGIAVGHGHAIIRNNIIWSVEGGIGIRVYQTFTNPSALGVTISNNTLNCGPGGPQILLHNGAPTGTPSPLKALVTVRNNYTGDRSTNSFSLVPGLFANPLTGNADAGSGPGSGFEQKAFRGIGADFKRIRKPPAN